MSMDTMAGPLYGGVQLSIGQHCGSVVRTWKTDVVKLAGERRSRANPHGSGVSVGEVGL